MAPETRTWQRRNAAERDCPDESTVFVKGKACSLHYDPESIFARSTVDEFHFANRITVLPLADVAVFGAGRRNGFILGRYVAGIDDIVRVELLSSVTHPLPETTVHVVESPGVRLTGLHGKRLRRVAGFGVAIL